MSDKRQPVELQMGALRALLRQPDLPPDLAAKIQERTDAEARRAKLDGGFRRRLPVIIMTLVAIAVAAILALVVMPETSETKPQATSPVVEPVSAAPGASPALEMVAQPLSNAALPANEAASVAPRSTPVPAIPGASQASRVSSGQPAGKVAPKPSAAVAVSTVAPGPAAKVSSPAETKQPSVPPASKDSAPETAAPTQAPALPDAPAPSPVDPAP